MKKFCVVMAFVFAVLAIIFYVMSIQEVKYGYEKIQVANVQMTVFSAAAAIACILNILGASILHAIENLEYYSRQHSYDKKPSPLFSNPGNTNTPLFKNSISDEETHTEQKTWICRKCGATNKDSFSVCSVCGGVR